MISMFKYKYNFLSNFHPSRIFYEGLWYPTVEHAYQAAKSTDRKYREKISEIPVNKPGIAKGKGSRVKLRSDWDEILKLGIFLHDIGKPESKTVDSTGRVHFRGHEIIGEDIVRNKSQQLGLELKAINLLSMYVRHHMTLLILYKTNNMSKENLDNIFEILQDDIIGTVILGYCDIISTRKLLNPKEDMNIIKTYMEYVLTNYIYKYKKLS